MTAKFTSLTCCRLYLFLVIVAYQPCTGKTSSIDVPSSSNLHHDTTAELKDVQHKRYLRVRMSTTMNQNVSSDERGLGKSSVMTVKDLTITTAEKIKSIIANARLKMSSKTQQATDLSFTTLNVNKVETNILESAEFQMWFKSVNKAYKNNVKEGEVAMVTTLTFYYGDEALIKLLNDAKSVSTTNVIAQKLEEAQFTRWLTDEKSEDDVFKLLKLDQVGESLFKSPLMPTWVGYANKFQTKPDEAIFLTLKTQFDDKALASMIIAVKEHSSIAARLEKVELEQWLSSGKTSDDIFRFLNLNDDNSNLLKNPAFGTWVSFVIKAEKENPYGYVFAKLSNRYDEQSLANVIHTARNDAKTKAIADQLEVVLQKNWFDEGKSANDVFKLLKLEKEGGAVLTSPLWSTWNSYVTILNKKNPKESIYSVLNAQYGENNLRMMISDAMKHARTKDVAVKLQEEPWRTEGNTADDIFKLLKLDEKVISFIESPMLSSWISYATKLGTLEEKSGEFAAIVYLESRFDNMDLARKLSLEKHRNNLAMTKGAKQLRILQFRYWINRGVDPQMIAKRLMRENDELDMTANVRVVIDFHEFYIANGGNRFY